MLTTITLAAWSLLPRFDGHLEAAHDLGLNRDLRGWINVGAAPRAFAGETWHLTLSANVHAVVRENRDYEGVVKISPQQVHFPTWARLAFPFDPAAPDGQAWGLFAFHQSNHDVDENDAIGNIEVVSYEIYGADWTGPGFRLAGGLYYDRGTTRALYRQNVPFDYYLFGVQAEGARRVYDPWYLAGRVELIAHRNEDHSPGFVNLGGHFDAGAVWAGAAAGWRVFLRFQRLEDYQFLGDAPEHMLLLGTAIDTIVPP